MKKTLVLTHEYYPFHGGIAYYCHNLFRRLPNGRYFIMTDQHNAADHGSIINHPFLSSFMRPRWLRGLRAARKVVEKYKIEMIFTPHILPLGMIANAIYRYANIPYVISLHGLDIGLALEKKPRQTITILSNAKIIVTNSKATRAIVEATGIKTPIEVITPCVDPGRLKVDPETQGELAKKYGSKLVILSVGRLVKRKGHDLVIKAMKEVLHAVPEAHYCIVGDGPERHALDQLIRDEGLRSHVDIIPSVSDREIGAYYDRATVFALPTRKLENDIEGFGIVYLEAAYFGLPIIAGITGGEQEALGNDFSTGIFIQNEDAHEVSESLIMLLRDSELSSFLGAQAKRHLDALPTWDQQAKKLETILS